METESLNAARVLMGDSLGFHIIFVMFGLTLPILVSWFEYMGLRRNDERLLRIAKLWSKVMALLVIAGVISGTIIALQMSLVWPGILKFGGEVIGLPFMFETYAFLIEAVFLGLYMLTWNSRRVSKWVHWVFGLFVILGATLSAYAITSVNAWMNYPTGFDYVDGKLVNINVAESMFSRTSLVEFVHSMPGYYLTVTLIIAGLYAFKLLRKRFKDRFSKEHTYDWFVINRLMLLGIALFVVSGITADITGKYLAKYEPVKLAAIELQYETGTNAPLLIGGVAGENQTVQGPHFEIPNALSLLAGNSPSAEVKGLNEFPKEEHPPLYVHTLFDIKMTIITYLVFFFLTYLLFRWRKPKLNGTWPMLLAIGTVGYLTVIVVELGWMITEIGRQPWSVRGFVTTAEALTKTHDITSFGYFFPLSYVALFVLTLYGVIRIVKADAVQAKRKAKI